MQTSTCQGASEGLNGSVSCKECSYLGSTVVQAVYSTKDNQNVLQQPCNTITQPAPPGALSNGSAPRVLYEKGWVDSRHTTHIFISNTSKTMVELSSGTFQVETMVKFTSADNDNDRSSAQIDRASVPVRLFFGSSPRKDVVLTLEIHFDDNLHTLSEPNSIHSAISARRMLNHTLRTQWLNSSSGTWVSVCTAHSVNMDDQTLTSTIPASVLNDASFMPQAVKCTRNSDPECQALAVGGTLSAAFVNVSDCSAEDGIHTTLPRVPSSSSLDYILAGTHICVPWAVLAGINVHLCVCVCCKI
jgi:hypothetical protein